MGNVLSYVIGYGIIGFIVYLIYRKFANKAEMKKAFAALPVDAPMQVNIEENYQQAGTFNSKQVPCGLKIDVKISQNDWRAIADAGLMKKVLFEADGPSGAQYDPENVRPWHVEDLKNITYASFWDADRMLSAKEKLIESLYNLRDHIDHQRGSLKKETLQI
jgi:hypothetical protein